MGIGIALNAFYMIIIGLMALALIYWYRDCDPLLTGAIKKFDEILPYYVQQNLLGVPGFSGLFLTGVVSAATSTISSIINSQAAVCYVDVVSPYKKLTNVQVSRLTKGLAFVFGFLMTIYAMIVPYLGSAVRIIMVMHNGASGPFVGMFLLALCFPWANSKGVVVGTVITTAMQFWQMFGKLTYNVHAPRMKVTLDYCALNSSLAGEAVKMATISQSDQLSSPYIFPLYRISSYWTVLITTVMTILIGLIVSLMTGGRTTCEKHEDLTSEFFLRMWRKLGVLPKHEKRRVSESQQTLDINKNDSATYSLILSDESFL